MFPSHDLGADGVWVNTELPGNANYDESEWDGSDNYDDVNSMFVGIIAGDIDTNDRAEIALNIKPLHKVMQDYPARNLLGYSTGGMAASRYIELIRDHTDGAGGFIFRPFFENTSTGFVISTTTVNYDGLDSAGASQIRDKQVWEVVEKLAESENYVPLITRDGKFSFKSRDPNTTTVAWEFHGSGSRNTEFGHNIKKINRFGNKMTRYFSRVEVKYAPEDTSSSFVYVESSLTVSGLNNTWNFGHRTFKIENHFIPDSATASTIATTVFNEVSALKNEIDFTTSFVPGIEILDRISVTYDSSGKANAEELWDLNDWDTELTWDSTKGNAIKLNAVEFDLLSIEVDLDKLENKFIGRAT